jgi:GWxTD domain-containing protein
MIRLTIAVSVVAAGWITAIPSPQSGSTLVVNAVRFYRSDQNRTRVRGLIEIPLSVVQAAGDQPGNVSYTVSVRVADSTGLTLYKQSWQNRALPVTGAADAYTVEIVDFAVAPGTYRLEAQVDDSTSRRSASSAVEVEALSARDMASDLLLAPDIRVAPADDTIPRPGEFRFGQYLVRAAARVRLTPLQTKVYYLMEAYADSGQAGTLSVSIRDSSTTVVHTPDLPVQVGVGGGVLKGQLDLAGLPEGAYTLVASLKLGDRQIERTAQFTMAGLQETMSRAAAQLAAARVADSGYFGAMSGPQLDSAEAPLGYVAKSGELSTWSSGLSLGAKRRFLTAFWMRRDPSPGTVRNERREGFYEAVAFANREYREGGRKTVPGWRSDRGRIYAKYGPPDDVLKKEQEGEAPPYEVWQYTSGKSTYYIFADRTGFGAFHLVYTDDLTEKGLPDWGDILGRRAVADVSQFIGIDLMAATRREEIVPRQRF